MLVLALVELTLVALVPLVTAMTVATVVVVVGGAVGAVAPPRVRPQQYAVERAQHSFRAQTSWS